MGNLILFCYFPSKSFITWSERIDQMNNYISVCNWSRQWIKWQLELKIARIFWLNSHQVWLVQLFSIIPIIQNWQVLNPHVTNINFIGYSKRNIWNVKSNMIWGLTWNRHPIVQKMTPSSLQSMLRQLWIFHVGSC